MSSLVNTYILISFCDTWFLICLLIFDFAFCEIA